MAKSKWEKLSAKMLSMLNGIDQYVLKIDEQSSKYSLLQMHFQATMIKQDQPRFSCVECRQMALTHCLSLRMFSMDLDLKEELKKPFFAPPIFRLPLNSMEGTPSSSTKTWIRWFVKIGFAQKAILKLSNLPWETLLYCPAHDEYPDCQDWFRFEDRTIFLLDKMQKLHREGKDEKIILSNLSQLTHEHFQKFLKVRVTKNTVIRIPFTPTSEENIKKSIERAIRFRKNRDYGQFYGFLQEWEEYQQGIIFKGVNWPQEKRKSCLARMKTFFYKRAEKNGFTSKPQENATSIDRRTAACIVHHFIQKIIEKPHDRKSGQIACILWILIWLSQEFSESTYSLNDIIFLSTQQVLPMNKSLLINEKEIEISQGLTEILVILMGKGSGKHNCRLFPDINRRNLKNAIENASKALFPDSSKVISIDSFLIFPHQFENEILSRSMLKVMKNPDEFIDKPGNTQISLLKKFESRLNGLGLRVCVLSRRFFYQTHP